MTETISDDTLSPKKELIAVFLNDFCKCDDFISYPFTIQLIEMPFVITLILKSHFGFYD